MRNDSSIERYLSNTLSPNIVINSEGHILNDEPHEEASYFKSITTSVSCTIRGITLIIGWEQAPSQKCKTRLISWLKNQPRSEYRVMPPAQVDTKTFNTFDPMLRYLTRIMKVI